MMVLHTHGSEPPSVVNGHGWNDTDVLAHYQRSRAQESPFADRAQRVIGFDEFVDPSGAVRPAWQEVADFVVERGNDGLRQLRDVVRGLVDNDGITNARIEEAQPHRGEGPSTWHLDALPLVLSTTDWDVVEAGLLQRSRVLDAVLTDLYGERKSITSGVLPAGLLFAHPGYVRAARGIELPGRHQLFLHACDVSRSAAGEFVVNADWTQAPSGAGYALADRRVLAHAVPDLYESVGPRPASPWARALRLALVDVAPESAEEPVVVVLSPGIHSETAFDQAYLAGVLGFPLVESADLVVRDGKLWMRSLGTLKRVDVVLRRVDAEYADPLELRPDSRLGVVGLVEVLRRGAVTVVNTLGSGILESAGLLRFLPQLADLLLGEELTLHTAPTYWGGVDVERSHLLSRLPTLLIRHVAGGDAIVGPSLSGSQTATLAARIDAAPQEWVGQELPEFATAPADLRPGGLTARNVGMRLFTVAQRGGYAPMAGGLGYVLAPGDAAHALTSVAAKDVWVRSPARVRVTPTPPTEVTTHRRTPGPARDHAISSPRVLSDLYWLGRYAERAESTARLLNVARERYHEFRYRRELPGSECVPMLLAALGRVTGTDTGAGGDDAEIVAIAPTTLWALTADERRPGALAQSVERLGQAARAVRDQMSNDTWMLLAAVERAVLYPRRQPPDSLAEGEAYLAAAHSQTLAGMLALSGVARESMVRDVGWTMMDLGKRIERGSWLTALMGATLTARRNAGAEQTITESLLVACESSVSYRRRTHGIASVSAVADLLLFDEQNPRSLAYQFERLRLGLRALPSSTGSSRPQRLVDEVSATLRRIDPHVLEAIDANGRRARLAELLTGMHAHLRELSTVITTTHLSVPGGMQPLWGPDERRVVP